MRYPKNWEQTTMGEIGRYLNGRAFKSGEWKSTGRPIIRIQNLTGSGSEFNYFQGAVEDRYIVKPGDLLFSWSATLGTYIWQGPEAVLNQHIFKVESHIDKNFHRHLLDFKIQEMQSHTHGSGMVHITKKSFDAIEVHIPPIDEQHKIVEILEDYLSRIDAALADVNQGQKKIRQFRRSFLRDAFIEQEGTRHCQLGDVVEIKTGKIDANRAVPDGKYPFFTCARDISRIDDAPFDGNVVLVAGNGDLNVKYYEGKFNAYQRTYILKSKNEEILFPKYLFWFMEHYIFELRTLAIGTTIKYIKLGNLMDAIMSLPAINIQKQMVLEIERSLSFVDNSEETFTKLIRESRSLRRAILNSAFSGELTNEVSHV